MQPEELFASVFVLFMMCGVFVIFMAMRQRSQQLEMVHRERMAMIERGQVPADPPHSGHRLTGGTTRPGGAGSRSMSLGIIVVAGGLGLMSIVGIAGGSAESGIGIGGAIVIVGLAFIVNSFVSRNTAANEPPPAPRQDGLS